MGKKLQCTNPSCKYEWISRIEGRPVSCPNCKCRYWDDWAGAQKRIQTGYKRRRGVVNANN